jgi:hypothetical protein
MEIQRLRNAAKKNRTARLLFEHLASREEGSTETSVESLVTELETVGTRKRVEVVKMLQYLESLGCGKFIPGRHTRPSRMCWSYDVRTIARLALENDTDESANQRSDEAKRGATRWPSARAGSESSESSAWEEILQGRE